MGEVFKKFIISVKKGGELLLTKNRRFFKIKSKLFSTI